MNPPSRFEIEKFANEKFQADLERRIDEYARKQYQALAQVRSRGNIGGYLPALIQCKQEKLRAEILALADAWVEAGTIYAVPLPMWAEKALEKAAAEMAAGTVSALRGELDLTAKRTLRTLPQDNTGAGNRAIESAMKSALREGKLKLKAQRIQTERLLRGNVSVGLQSDWDLAQGRLHPQEIAKGAVPNAYAFWRDLETQFRALTHRIRLVATVIDGRWSFTFDGPSDQMGRKRLRQLFDSLARRATVAAGTPNQANAIEGWLNLLRHESPYFQPFAGSSTSEDGIQKDYKGGWIQDLALASAEYCIVCATRAFELEVAAVRAAESGLPKARETGTAHATGSESPGTGTRPAVTSTDRNGADRRAAVDAYIAEVLERTGKRITRTDIWKSARYKTRTEFERWERHDKRATKAAHKVFTDILANKPHLK